MKTKAGKEGAGLKLWKRNAVVVAIVVFVCAAVYLNWSYQQEGEEASSAGKTLGQAALVGANTDDPLVGEDTASAGEENTDTAAEQDGNDYFSAARLNRQQARDSALSLLQDAAESESADQSARDAANLSIQAMATATVTEAQIENLVMAKGYADCVAFIGEESISVVVSAGEAGLTDTDTARITDIAASETGFSPERIKIIEAD